MINMSLIVTAAANNVQCYYVIMLVRHEYFMFKLIWTNSSTFFKKNNLLRQMWRLRDWRITFRFYVFLTLNHINQLNVTHIKLSKYCHIDAYI